MKVEKEFYGRNCDTKRLPQDPEADSIIAEIIGKGIYFHTEYVHCSELERFSKWLLLAAREHIN